MTATVAPTRVAWGANPSLPKWVRRWLKRVAGIGVVAVLGWGATGCASSNNFRDVEGVKSQRPDLIENYNNMDGHPNVGRLCIHGAAFATTTRDFNAIMRVPKWDDDCP